MAFPFSKSTEHRTIQADEVSSDDDFASVDDRRMMIPICLVGASSIRLLINLLVRWKRIKSPVSLRADQANFPPNLYQ